MNNGAVNLHQLFDLVADGGDAYAGDGSEPHDHIKFFCNGPFEGI